jgi:ribosome maturation factor RimP
VQRARLGPRGRGAKSVPAGGAGVQQQERASSLNQAADTSRDGTAGSADAQRPAGRPAARTAIETTVTGLGYELVDVEREARGLLRVTIDRVPGRHYPSGDSEFVTVDDCELVTRQLQYALEVDAVAYERLEVSSPGLDRPLKVEAHYLRFEGQQVSIALKQPFQGRKAYKGVLVRADAGWSLVFDDGKGEQVLGFGLDEVREARLVPVVDFKGRKKAGGAADAAAQPAADGGQDR